MKKVLILASVASMIDQFNRLNIDILKELGYQVHVAANFIHGNTCSASKIEEFKKELKNLGVVYYQIDFSRSITKVTSNINAYKQVKNLMENNNYDFIHCHSPIGGFCGRIAGYKTRTPVIYTAHGFHFYKGSPLKNWILYYPIEYLLSNYTDVLITINKEDYYTAKKLKAKIVKYVPGIGINVENFTNKKVDRNYLRYRLGIPSEAFVLLSVGELNKNKNHETIIKAIAKLNNPNIYYIICGKGVLEGYLKNKIKDLGIEKQVKLLGFRKDINEIYHISNAFVFPSYREGLSVALMEAMASGLPIICSNIRGNTDLVENGKGGYLVSPNDIEGFSSAINKLINSDLIKFSQSNIEKLKDFSKEKVREKTTDIYKELEGWL